MSTIAWKFGGWGRSPRVASATNRASRQGRPGVVAPDRREVRGRGGDPAGGSRDDPRLVAHGERVVVARLKPDRGRRLHAHPRPATQRPAEVARPYLRVRREREQL